MGRGLWLAALVAVVCLGGAAVPSGSARADATPVTSTYQDTTGESDGAPDLTQVVVSEDGTGQLSFAVDAPGLSAPLAGTADVQIFLCIDADRSISTGSLGGGCDYGLRFTRFTDQQFVDYTTYPNHVRQSQQNPADVAASLTGDVVTFSLAASKIGAPAVFDFYAYAAKVPGIGYQASGEEYAPDHGWWTFPSATPPVGHSVQTGTSGTPFAEPTGDARGTIDLSNIVLQDAPADAVTFGFSVAGLADNGEVDFFVDADHNPATGENGNDFDLGVFNDPDFGWTWVVLRWGGSQWLFEDIGTATATGAGVTATVPRHDLNGSNGFDFYVLAQNFDSKGNTLVRDDAPDTQWYTYAPAQLAGAQLVKPVFGKPKVTGSLVAGKTVTLTFPVHRSDNGALFKVTGVNGDGPMVGSAYLPAKVKVGLGFVRWTITVPKRDKGKFIALRFGAFDAYQIAYETYSKRIR